MDSTIAAIVSALITGIIGPISALAIQKKLKDSEFPTFSKERVSRLKGKWYGRFTQMVADKEVTFDVAVSLKNQGKVIEGDVRYDNQRGERVCLIMYNGMFDGNILKIEYKNELPYIFQKGSVIVEMNARGDALHGRFVGYSPDQKKVIVGELSCTDRPVQQNQIAP
jgi:hypothetical protein